MDELYKIFYIITVMYFYGFMFNKLIDLFKCQDVIYNSYRNYFRDLLSNDVVFTEFALYLSRFDEESIWEDAKELSKEVQKYTEDVITFSNENNFKHRFVFVKDKNLFIRLYKIFRSRYLNLLKFYYISEFSENIIWKAFADEKYLETVEEFKKRQLEINKKIEVILERNKL